MSTALITLGQDLQACRDLEEFWGRICRELENYGISSAMYAAIAFRAEVDKKRVTSSAFIKTNHCRDYIETFGENTLIDDDYTAEVSVTSSEPLIWHTAQGWDGASKAQLKRGQIEREMGYFVGITVPTPYVAPGKLGGFGLAARSISPDEFDRMWTHKQAEIIAILAMLDSGMRREHMGELIGLSPREKECLTYLASGSRPAEIADKLKISEKTLEIYVRGAKLKLKAGTRDSAVAKSILFNLIDP